MDKEYIISTLRKENLITNSTPEFKPLKGGVSSDIFLVSDGDHNYVVKQALKKLRVEDDWYADLARNRIEREFLQFLQNTKPGAAPDLLYSDDENQFFVMEYLDKDFSNWKQQLLNGIFDVNTAEKCADLLAEIHLQSWKNESLKKQFNNAENFYSLRTEPYLVTTGKRHPELRKLFFEEAERLNNHQEALVHGDFSPKNIMVKANRIVLLDHEVAWFGDPAFDMAFFLNHLYLKMLVHYKKEEKIRDLTTVVWNVYFNKLGEEKREQMEQRITRLLLMIMLARIDGKSPVEYLEQEEKEFVRSFVRHHLLAGSFSQALINKKWKEKLNQAYN